MAVSRRVQRTHCLYVWSVEKRNHLKQYVCSVQMMQWWQVIEPDPNEERGVRWVCGCFHGLLCWLGRFQGQPELPRGVSWSTWRVFEVNLICYETYEI